MQGVELYTHRLDVEGDTSGCSDGMAYYQGDSTSAPQLGGTGTLNYLINPAWWRPGQLPEYGAAVRAVTSAAVLVRLISRVAIWPGVTMTVSRAVV